MVTELSRAIARPPRVRGIAGQSAMHGLQRRSLGFVEVLGQSIGAIAPSAVAGTVPALLAARTGGGVLLALAAGWLLAALVASAIGQYTRRMAAPGSLYTFATKGLGAGAGFTSAIGLMCGYGFVAMAALLGAAHYLQTLFQLPTGTIPSIVLIAAITGVVVAVLWAGIRISARVTIAIECVAIAAVIVLMAIVLAHTPVGSLSAPFTQPFPQLGDLFAGIAFAMTAFVGFESSASLGVESTRPFATIPRVMRWSILGTGFFYLLSAYTQLAAFHAAHISLESVQTPVNVLASNADIGWIGTILDAGLAASFMACAIASLTALSRVLFSLGREGVLPSRLGLADPGSKAPRVAFALVAPVVALVPILLLAVGWSPEVLMPVLLSAAVPGYLVSYCLVCASVPLFLRRIGEPSRRAAWSAVMASAFIVTVFVTYLIITGTGRLAFADALVAIVALGAGAGYLLVRANRGRALRRMGLFDQTTASDLLGGPP
ncbi:APC family permease [Rathayibacter sp. KR2-224]|uniref:APC family permease n=1 Tax=Rathayibacter sp. KR2-224 TaxID=3400913 RepID=UPI003C1201F1